VREKVCVCERESVCEGVCERERVCGREKVRVCERSRAPRPKPFRSSAHPVVDHIRQSRPYIRQSMPDIRQSRPDIRQPRPDIRQSRPDIRQSRPDWDTRHTRSIAGAKIEAFKVRFRAKREQLKRFKGLLPESQGQNPALTVLYVLSSLDSGLGFDLAKIEAFKVLPSAHLSTCKTVTHM